ncbi:phosphotransferase [Glycomyces halotolerans]
MELIGAGRASRVYALDDRRVLRRGDFDVEYEARVMKSVRAAGFPVPEVFSASGGELVMERLHGPTMAAEVVAGRLSAGESAGILLGLLERLAPLEAPEWMPASPRGVGFGAGRRLLHLDLHPENVVLTEAGPYVIDWTNAAAGEPDFDRAVTWAIMAGVDLAGMGLPAELIADVSAQMLVPLREGLREDVLGAAARFREADPNLDRAEMARVRAALGGG